jgi:hypothetical protein
MIFTNDATRVSAQIGEKCVRVMRWFMNLSSEDEFTSDEVTPVLEQARSNYFSSAWAIFRGVDAKRMKVFQFPNTLKRAKIVQSKKIQHRRVAAAALCLDT